MQLVFEHEFVSIKHDKKNQLLQLTWEGYITSEDYVKIMREMLTLTHKLGIKFWLSDARYSDDIQMGDMSWTINHMADYIKDTKLCKIARVIKPGNTSQPNINKLIASDRFQHQQQVKFRIFSNLTEAKDWLLTPLTLPENKIVDAVPE